MAQLQFLRNFIKKKGKSIKIKKLGKDIVTPQDFLSFVPQKHHEEVSEKKAATYLDVNWSKSISNICKHQVVLENNLFI